MDIEYLDKIKSEYKWQHGNITFYDTELNETELISIETDILNKGDYENIVFNNINIIDFGSNLFLLEIEEKELKNYKKIFIENFKQDGFFAKKLKNNRQSPKYKGYLKNNGKNYIMVDGLNKLTDEVNSELGIYKGIIVNPELYFGKVGEEIDSIEDKVKDIL